MDQHELTVDADSESKKNTGNHERGDERPSRPTEHTITVSSRRRWIQHDAHEHGSSTTDGRSAARLLIASQDYGVGEGERASSRSSARGGRRLSVRRRTGWRNGTRRMLAGNGTRAA